MRDLFPTEELVNAKANFPDLTVGMRADEYICDKYIFQKEEKYQGVCILYRTLFQSGVDTREGIFLYSVPKANIFFLIR